MSVPQHVRQGIAGLALSAAMLVSLLADEGYTDEATVPVKGDVPTNGFGGTVNADGTPVKMGDRITPVAALRRSMAHIQKDESRLKQCVTAPLQQREYDLLVDHAYQYGPAATCRSGMVRSANAGDYRGMCDAYKGYRLVRAARGEPFGPGMVIGDDGVMRYDCSTLVDGRRNRRCWGVWERSKERFDHCMAVQ